jgi:hypothetical protein
MLLFVTTVRRKIQSVRMASRKQRARRDEAHGRRKNGTERLRQSHLELRINTKFVFLRVCKCLTFLVYLTVI